MEGLGISRDFIPLQTVISDDPIDSVMPLLENADVEVRRHWPLVNASITCLPMKIQYCVCHFKQFLIGATPRRTNKLTD